MLRTFRTPMRIEMSVSGGHIQPLLLRVVCIIYRVYGHVRRHKIKQITIVLSHNYQLTDIATGHSILSTDFPDISTSNPPIYVESYMSSDKSLCCFIE